MEKVQIDSFNKKTGKSNIFKIPFNRKCPKHYYKAGVTVQTRKNPTYHFYRQDKSGRFSHKQGTLPIENKDSNNLPLWAPHLAGRNYDPDNDGSGIVYDKWCNYFCVPRNYYANTHAI